MEYRYRDSDHRIVEVKEAHQDTPGQTYGIRYNADNTTAFRFSGVDDVYGNDDDIENIHVFDEQGRAVCIYTKLVKEDKILGATACTYEADKASDGTENTDKRNKIKDTAVVGMHTNNLLTNHSFEYSDKKWTLYKNEGETPEKSALSARSSAKKYSGSYSAYCNMAKRTDGVAGFKQEAKLDAGTYTLSGYCTTSKIKNTSAYLKVKDAAGNVYISNKVTQETSAVFDNGWERLEVTFTIDTAQTVTVYLETDCGTAKGAGTVAFDCIQLEAGKVANDYNLLEDGSFEITEETLPYKWKNLDKSSNLIKDERVSGGVDGDSCYHITGQPGKDKYLKVSVDLGSDKNAYVLSGWIKTNSTPIRKTRDFLVMAHHHEETEDVIIDLKVSNNINAYSEGWKYFCMILPAASWKSTTFTIRFYDNIGDLYIDGLQLTRNDVQTRKYDSAGRITSQYTAQKSTSSTYDGYSRLKTQTAPSGAQTTYTYAGNNDVTKLTANIGPAVYMKYDKYGNLLSTSTRGSDKAELFASNTYTEDGNFLTSVKDNRGYETRYAYDEKKGLMTGKTLPLGSTIFYQYDHADRMTGVSQADRAVGYSYGEFDDLTGITHNGFTYGYTYDGFGNVLTTSIAGQTIRQNVYQENNGSLKYTVYADGTATANDYDEYGKVTASYIGILKNSETGEIADKQVTDSYLYDNDGNVAQHTDVQNGILTEYEYNDSDQVVRSSVGSTDTTKDRESRTQYTYTASGKIKILSYREADGKVRTYENTYAKDDQPTKNVLPDGSYVSKAYDTLRRNNKTVYAPTKKAADTKKLYTIVTYEKRDASEKTLKGTTDLVSSFINKFGSNGKAVSSFQYTYDGNGNVTGITALNGAKAQYTYNEYCELIRAEETYADGSTRIYEYTYDAGGNITQEVIKDGNGTVLETNTYQYDTVWKDKLVSYNGESITYDAFGNPTSYKGTPMIWDIHGNLKHIKGMQGKDISYTYLSDGQRYTKTVDGVQTTYHYNNGLLLSETTEDETIRYYYDSDDNVVEIGYQKGSEAEKYYFFAHNAFGDVIALYRSSDSVLIGTYEYDAWGRPVSVTEAQEGIDTDGILQKNPFRYRGYYYDNETGFYYLNARYYAPELRRFISADDQIAGVGESVIGYNLFAYCNNNPVGFADYNGHMSSRTKETLKNIAIGAGVVAIGALCVAAVIASGGTAAGALALAGGGAASGGAAALSGAAAVATSTAAVATGVCAGAGTVLAVGNGKNSNNESGKASDLPTIEKGTKEWDEAVKSIANGGNTSYRTRTATEAKKLLNEARGNMNNYKRYTSKQYKKGYEMHPNEINTRNASQNNLPHVKWKDWLAGGNSGKGHIFFNTPN